MNLALALFVVAGFAATLERLRLPARAREVGEHRPPDGGVAAELVSEADDVLPGRPAHDRARRRDDEHREREPGQPGGEDATEQRLAAQRHAGPGGGRRPGGECHEADESEDDGRTDWERERRDDGGDDG